MKKIIITIQININQISNQPNKRNISQYILTAQWCIYSKQSQAQGMVGMVYVHEKYCNKIQIIIW